MKSLITNDAVRCIDKKSLQTRMVFVQHIEKYLWTSKTLIATATYCMYIYTRDRYVESQDHYRHIFMIGRVILSIDN